MMAKVLEQNIEIISKNIFVYKKNELQYFDVNLKSYFDNV